MNSKTEQKIKAILSVLRNKASNSFEGKIRKIAHSHDSHPMFITNVMAREAARAAQYNVLELVADAVTEVSAVSRTLDAFGLLKGAMFIHLSDLAGLVEQWNGVHLNPADLGLVDELFAAVRQVLIVNIDANQHRFKNPGGRSAEWDWDGAKAHIGTSFPKGFKNMMGCRLTSQR